MASVDMIYPKMSDTATTTDLELATRQREKLAQLQVNKAKNSRFVTQENQKNQIQRLDDLANRRAKPTFSDTNLVKGRSLLTVEVNGTLVQKLVRPGTNLRFVPVEEMFSVLKSEHELSNHRGRDVMQDRIKKKYANVTVELIIAFKCGLKKSRTRKGIVVKPILTRDAWIRCQTDLIDMQSQADGEYKYIQHIAILPDL